MLAEGDIPAALAANGAQLVVLHGGDELGVDALLELAAASVREPEADFVYGDEQRIDPATGRLAPCFKPGWSPELLLSTNYIGRPWAVSADLVRRAAVSVADGDYDLALRLTEQAAKIVHVPRILCRRGAEPVDHADRDRPALARATERRGIAGEVLAGGVPGLYRLKRAVSTTGLVSIVMPTAGVGGLVKKAIGTLRAVTAYRNVEIVVVDNIPDGDAAMRDWVKQNADTVVRLDAPFNWSRFNNEGVAAAKGEFLLFLNDDIEIVQPDWLDALLEHAERPEVGIVGPKLLYPDSGGVQSAGAFLSDTGGRNAFRFLEADAPGPFGLAMTQRDVVAVTGACMMVRTRRMTSSITTSISACAPTGPACAPSSRRTRRLSIMRRPAARTWRKATIRSGLPLRGVRFSPRATRFSARTFPSPTMTSSPTRNRSRSSIQLGPSADRTMSARSWC
jgi:hypothetical protein